MCKNMLNFLKSELSSNPHLYFNENFHRMLFSLRFSGEALISSPIRRHYNIKYLNSFYYFIYNYKTFGETKQGKQIRTDYTTHFGKSYNHELKLCDEKKIKFNPS